MLGSVLNEMLTMLVMVVLLLSLGLHQGLTDDSIPGRPGRDYPIYDSIPPTLFSCFGQVGVSRPMILKTNKAYEDRQF